MRNQLTFATSVGAMILLVLVGAPALAQTPTALFLFDGTHGETPYGSLAVGGSSLYGMAQYGGANNKGTIFSLSTSGGTATTLFDFDVTNGARPIGNLTLSPDGSTLYGMTVNGGAFGAGTIFSLSTSGGTPAILYSFEGVYGTHGGYPNGSLILSGSTLYGMTCRGGPVGYGTIFRISTSGGTPNVLFTFDGAHGQWPVGNVTLSPDGLTLYGMTQVGGVSNSGTIFSISTSGGTPTVLFSFDGTHGYLPEGSLTLSPDGSTLYGMTEKGGAQGRGIIFSIPSVGGTPTVMFNFDSTNGAYPFGSLTLSGSTLFGLTEQGGDYGDGVIFSISTSGNSPTILYSFDGNTGSGPQGSLTFSPDGSTLYGMTAAGGDYSHGSGYGGGVIFSFLSTPPGYTLTVNQTTGGTVTVSPSQVIYYAGDTVTITASALPGYLFPNWTTIDGAAYDPADWAAATTTITVLGNVTLEAEFDPIICYLTGVGGPPEGGSVRFGNVRTIDTGLVRGSISPIYVVTNATGTSGQVIPISERTNPGFAFTGWTVTDLDDQDWTFETVDDPAAPSANLTIPDLSAVSDLYLTVTADFAPIPYLLTVNQTTGGNVTVQVMPVITGPKISALAPPSNQFTLYYGNTAVITATASDGYAFVNWTATDSNGSDVTDTTVDNASSSGANFAMPAFDVTLTAWFTPNSFNGTETATGGTTSVSDSGPYAYGQVITITASALPGYVFSGWNVTGASALTDSTAAVTQLTVYDNFALTANFILRPLGDINGDGVADQNDLDILNNRLNGFDISSYTDADCDLNGDGVVTTADRVLLRKILNGPLLP